MKRWSVVLLNFPFTDLRAIKVRPAVVVSPDSFHDNCEDAVFMLITSNTERQGQTEVLIDSSHPEFAQTGLHKSSMIRVSKLITLHQNMVQAEIGKLGPSLVSAVNKELKAFLGF